MAPTVDIELPKGIDPDDLECAKWMIPRHNKHVSPDDPNPRVFSSPPFEQAKKDVLEEYRLEWDKWIRRDIGESPYSAIDLESNLESKVLGGLFWQFFDNGVSAGRSRIVRIWKPWKGERPFEAPGVVTDEFITEKFEWKIGRIVSEYQDQLEYFKEREHKFDEAPTHPEIVEILIREHKPRLRSFFVNGFAKGEQQVLEMWKRQPS